MSQTYDIACMQCREALWIAQSGIGGMTLYSGEPKTMEHLREFLFRHSGHHLEFRDSQHFDDFKQLWEEPDEDSDPVPLPERKKT